MAASENSRTNEYTSKRFYVGNLFHEDQKIPDSESMSQYESYVGQVNSKCSDDIMDSDELKERLEPLKLLIDLKRQDDGFSSRKENPSFCKSSYFSTTNQ